MDSAGAGGGSLPPNFMLTPQQQNLLFAALNSNRQSSDPSTNGFQDSPLFDNIDYSIADSSFDFSFNDGEQPSMIGDLSETARSDSAEQDSHEKRSHPDDEDGLASESDPKRRESTDKQPKKPGRKPLTSEPTSKRKAQNRAAQRAFRERKEQHLKDLETKVDELQKASENANNENAALRAQVQRMTAELEQYKNKTQLMSNSAPPAREKQGFGPPALSGLNDVNFQFEFPRFGMLPGPPNNKQQRSASQPISPQKTQGSSPARSKTNDTPNSQDAQFKDDLARFQGVFTPSMSSSITNASRASLDSGNFSVGGATSSPSASSQSNAGPSSSCGTSPEPLTQSPMGFKPVETLTTIGEEQPTMSASAQPFGQFANMDFSNTNFDWLAQQNGGQFDPQLFGDYREPQNNVLANPSFDDFFNDAVDTDFFTPFNMAPTSPPTTNGAKKNLIDEIDAKQNSADEAPKKENVNCNQIWDKLQACPDAQNGDFDLDGLCSELTAKATCSGQGPLVGEDDFDTILKKYMGKDVKSSECASKLGIEVAPSKK